MKLGIREILIVLGIVFMIIRGCNIPTGRYDLGWIGASLIGIAVLLPA